MVSYFQVFTEQQRGQLWNSWSFSFAVFPLYLEKTTKDQAQNTWYAYDFSLFTKELMLNTSSDFTKIINENGTPESIEKYNEIKLLKLKIQRLLEKPMAERYLNVDSLENIAQRKEAELVRLSKEYGDYTRNLKITWKDVQDKLSDNDVAIEFVEYPTLTDTIKYAALVLRKGWQYPKMITLFHKDQIEEYIKQEEDEIYSYSLAGKQIKKLLWEPLEEFIAPGERIYFSPAGILHQLAIENLAYDDSTNLDGHYQMYRLSSTKELVTQETTARSNTAVVYGGLDYDLEEEEMITESKKFDTKGSFYAWRGYNADNLTQIGRAHV